MLLSAMPVEGRQVLVAPILRTSTINYEHSVFTDFRGRKINVNFFCTKLLRTLRVMDVHAENRGRPHQKVRFSAALMMGRNFLSQGHPGVRVRNVHENSDQMCMFMLFFIPRVGAYL